MKRFACLFLMMGMVLVLAACGGGSNPIRDRGTVLDYRSILDTELNLMFSLGDYRGDVEALLGVPFNEFEMSDDGRQGVVYDNGLLITYENNHIVHFLVANIFYYPSNPEYEEARFEILDVPIGATKEQVAVNFEPNGSFYRRFDVGDIYVSHVSHFINWFSGDAVGYNINIRQFAPR